MTTFGKDIGCTTSLRSGQTVSGVRLVAEACFRRITTPRGMLRGSEEEADYGMDVLELVGTVTTKDDLAALEGQIRGELVKDERIEFVDVTASQTIATNGAITVLIFIEATTAEGPFALNVGIADLTVELLGISTEAS